MTRFQSQITLFRTCTNRSLAVAFADQTGMLQALRTTPIYWGDS